MILLADDFDRVGANLGAFWTELGPPAGTDMSTDGANAVIDAVAFHIATAVGTESSDHYVQCWMQSPNASNNCGVCWRVLDANNFYMAIMIPTLGVYLFRRAASVFTLLSGPTGGIGTGRWHRLAVVHVGDRITVYLDQNYNTAFGLEGPLLDYTDGTPLVGVGRSGIISTGNNATGAAGPLWNDFCARDGVADTIYVDLDFNGGLPGAGWGSDTRPDLGIPWALNNCGCVRGSKIKLTDPLYGDAGSSDEVSIGHAGRFDAAGYTFPTYDPDCGGCTDPGTPNLLIEGMDGGRTELNESSGAGGKPFFKLREGATGIVFRALDFVLPFNSSAGVRLGLSTPAGEHSIQLAKCTFALTRAAGNLQANTYDASGTLDVQAFFCYWKNATGASSYFEDMQSRIRRYVAEWCVFQGNGSTGTLLAAISVGTGVDPQAGDDWRVSHSTFVDIYTAATNTAALSILDAAGFLGFVSYRNNVHRGKTALLPMAFGVFTNGLALGAGGVIDCHHNGYFNVTTPRDTGATDSGNEILTDPAFIGGPSWAWLQTAGAGVNGEGISAAFMLDTDYTPGNADYLDSASDSSAVAGVLNRGAIQDWVECGPDGAGILPPGPTPGQPSVPARFIRGLCPPDYCIEVLYDPLNATGAGPEFLSSELMDMRPLRDSKDYLLRDYRAQDVDLVFSDRDGRLDPRRSTSFLAGINYFKARVEVRMIDNMLGTISTLYVGELLTVATELGKTTWRLGNPFKRLLDKPLLANTFSRIVTTNGSTLASGAGSGNYLGYVWVNAGCRVETWTFTFINNTQFTVSGSLTGDDGAGSIGSTFNSESGAITAYPIDWAGTFAAGNRVSIQTVYQAVGNVISALLAVLQDPEGGDLPLWEIDIDAFTDQVGSPINQPIDLVIDREQTVLKTLADLARHMSATVFPLPDGRISIVTFVPRLQDRSDSLAFCHWDDLIDLTTDEIPIYNQFTFQWDYDADDTAQYRQTLVWPKSDADNPSLQAFGVRQEAPATIELRGFAAGQDTVVEQLAQQFYNRWAFPQELLTVKLKARRYGLTMADPAYIQSVIPFREVFVELVELRKRFTGGAPEIEADAVNVDRFIQGPDACGFVFYVPQHRADDCWIWF